MCIYTESEGFICVNSHVYQKAISVCIIKENRKDLSVNLQTQKALSVLTHMHNYNIESWKG